MIKDAFIISLLVIILITVFLGFFYVRKQLEKQSYIIGTLLSNSNIIIKDNNDSSKNIIEDWNNHLNS